MGHVRKFDTSALHNTSAIISKGGKPNHSLLSLYNTELKNTELNPDRSNVPGAKSMPKT